MSQAKSKFGCCQSCRLKYHLNCVNILKQLKDLTEDFKSKFTCPGCHSKIPKSDNTNTPIRPSGQSACYNQQDQPDVNYVNSKRGSQSSQHYEPSVTSDNIRQIIKEELVNVLSSLKNSILTEFELKTTKLLDRLNEVSETLKTVEHRQESLEAEAITNSNKIKALETENISLKATVTDLQSRITRIEQHSRDTNLEIQNVPEHKAENLCSIVKQISTVINYKLEDTDIQLSTRIAKISNETQRPRSMVIKFNSQRTRDGFLAAALQFNKKNKNPADKLNSRLLGIGGVKKPVFVVEHLSPAQKALHAAARTKSRELQYKFVWVRGGRIYMRKSESTEYILIKNTQDLAKLV